MAKEEKLYSLDKNFGENGEPIADVIDVFSSVLGALLDIIKKEKQIEFSEEALEKYIPKKLHKYFK